MKVAARWRVCLSSVGLGLGLAVLLFAGSGVGDVAAQEQPVHIEMIQVSPYFAVGTTMVDGDVLAKAVISGPPEPPEGYPRQSAGAPLPADEGATRILSNVPAFNWCFGCSATSAAMMAGYYDRIGYPNMYTGPTNGGVMPLNNSSWSDWVDGCLATRHRCPLSATQNGLDGRGTNGHVDDYWVCYGDAGPDPFDGNWTEHTLGDCTGDYMRTNQASAPYNNRDGSTSFYYYPSGAKFTGIGTGLDDGGYGFQLFYQSRGYTVVDRYNQLINGYDWPGDSPDYGPADNGADFADYKAEIDAGRPVMVHVEGHTMVGIGYDDSTTPETVYLHDTWDYGTGTTHSMPWGGYYGGMLHMGITVVTLQSAAPAGTAATFRVTSSGDVLADAWFYASSFATGSADVAEWVSVSEPVAAGSVVELDPGNPGSYRLSSGACSPSIAGVISTEPGMVLGRSEAFEERALLALVGIIPTYVTDEGGPILPGDLLVSSSTPGYAMRWSESGPCPCALVGKALEPMTGDEGLILVLLTAH